MNRRHSELYCKDILIHRAKKITYARLRTLATLRHECIADTIDAALGALAREMAQGDRTARDRFDGMVAAWMREG